MKWSVTGSPAESRVVMTTHCGGSGSAGGTVKTLHLRMTAGFRFDLDNFLWDPNKLL